MTVNMMIMVFGE